MGNCPLKCGDSTPPKAPARPLTPWHRPRRTEPRPPHQGPAPGQSRKPHGALRALPFPFASRLAARDANPAPPPERGHAPPGPAHSPYGPAARTARQGKTTTAPCACALRRRAGLRTGPPPKNLSPNAVTEVGVPRPASQVHGVRPRGALAAPKQPPGTVVSQNRLDCAPSVHRRPLRRVYLLREGAATDAARGKGA